MKDDSVSKSSTLTILFVFVGIITCVAFGRVMEYKDKALEMEFKNKAQQVHTDCYVKCINDIKCDFEDKGCFNIKKTICDGIYTPTTKTTSRH